MIGKARTTMPSYWLRWGLLNYLPRLASQNPISVSQVARMAGVGHCAQPLLIFLSI
jgi:hypothetical protein